MHLVLHIGMPKTGSTFLQWSLLRTQSWLAKHGVLYPSLDGIGHAHTHLLIADWSNPLPRFLTDIYGQNPARLRQAATKLIGRLEEEIEASSAQTCILSSEGWFSHPGTLLAEPMIEFISRRFDSVRLIGYARRPSDYFPSALQQSLKRRPTLMQPKPVPFRNTLRALERTGPVEMFDFDAARRFPGGLAVHFLSLLGISGWPSVELPTKAGNSTFSAEGMVLLRQYRLSFPENERERLHSIDRHFLKTLNSAETTTPCPLTKPILKHSMRALLDQDCDDLQFLKRTQGIDFISGPGGRAIPEIRRLDDLIDINYNNVGQLWRQVWDQAEPELRNRIAQFCP